MEATQRQGGGWLVFFLNSFFFLQSFFLIKYFYNYNTVSVYGVRKWTKYALTWYLIEVFMIKCPKHINRGATKKII